MELSLILLYISLILVFIDIILLSMHKKFNSWQVYDNIVLYLLTLFLFISYSRFLLNLINLDYNYEYVSSFASNDMDLFLRIAASWSGSSGSFFLWLILLYVCYITFRIVFRYFISQDVYRIASILLSANLLAFFIFVILKDPFIRNLQPVTDGIGLNPSLANIFNIIHPPIVFISYSIFSIPFSLALAKIITNQGENTVSPELQRFLRFTMALGWLILGLGILLGGYWAYISLGWGGYWAWDPVETGSLIPWLFALVYFHSSPVFKKKEDNLGKDVVATLPYLTIIFATIVTRTGLVSSVHAFGLTDSDYVLFLFIGSLLIIEIIFIIKRQNRIKLFFSLDEFKKLKQQDQALYISFNAFLIGTIAIILGLILPMAFALLPEPYTRTVDVDTKYFNTIIGLFGLIALEAAFFTDFVFIKKTSNIVRTILAGMILGATNVIIGLPIVKFTFIQSGLGNIYSIISIFTTTSGIANFIIPILTISLIVIIITIIKFIKSVNMQKQVKMRHISQSLLHLGIIIALLGVSISYNTPEINSMSIATGNDSGKIDVGSKIIEIKIMNMTYKENFKEVRMDIKTQIDLFSNGNLVGKGELEYIRHFRFGLISSVLIFSKPLQDYYVTMLEPTNDDLNGSLLSIRYQIRIIQMILPLWIGASIVLFSMVVLVAMTFRLWLFAYKKSIHKKESSPLARQRNIKIDNVV